MQKKIRLNKSKSISCLKLPFDFFENHFRNMSSETVKVYLYILYLCTLGDIELEDREIAKRLNLGVADIRDAYKELKETGLLSVNPQTGEEELVNPDDYYKILQKKSNTELKKETEEKIKVLDFNDDFKKKLEFIEDVYKKELTQNDMLEIYDLMINQKVPFDVLVCAVEYSLSKNIKRLNYISKIAINFKELGLNSYESCEKYISYEKTDEDRLYENVKKIFNIKRELFDAEKKYIYDWYYNHKKTLDDIKKALDITVINTGKLSFPYLNKILIDNQVNFVKKPNKKKNTPDNFTQREYDYDDILTALRKKQNN